MTATTATSAATGGTASANLTSVTLTDSPGTEYLVFKKAGDGWDPVNTITARSADQAIRDVAAKLAEKDQDGTFVAIPARSFKPVTVKKQTVTTLKLEEAK
jgi:hypothetical protein